jgi:hypothetical protein
LFIPAAGFRDGYDDYYVGFSCYLWTSEFWLDDPSSAYDLFSISINAGADDHTDRYNGFSIRPVINL